MVRRGNHLAFWGKVWELWATGVVLLLTLYSLAAYWYFYVPMPGKAVAAIAVAAVIMTFRGRINGVEKLLWMVVLFLLLFAEIRAIDRDRREYAQQQASARVEEQRNFQSVLKANQQEFQATADSLRALISSGQQVHKLTEKVLNNATGGDSFCYFTLGFPRPATGELLGMIIVKGEYPLHDVWMRLVDQARFQELLRERRPTTIQGLMSIGQRYVQLNDLPGASEKPLFELHFDNKTDKMFNITFGALNGNWNETYRLKRIKGEWREAIKVTRLSRPGNGKLLYEQVDPRYPKRNGQIDW